MHGTVGDIQINPYITVTKPQICEINVTRRAKPGLICCNRPNVAVMITFSAVNGPLQQTSLGEPWKTM